MKIGHRLEGIVGNQAEYLLAIHPFKGLIAAYAAAEKPSLLRPKGNLRMQFANLVHGRVLMKADDAVSSTPGLASCQNKPAGPGVFEHFRIVKGFITRVVAQNAQPFCHLSEHAINHKTPC